MSMGVEERNNLEAYLDYKYFMGQNLPVMSEVLIPKPLLHYTKHGGQTTHLAPLSPSALI